MSHERELRHNKINQGKDQDLTVVTFAPPTLVDALKFYPSAIALLEGVPLGLYKLGGISPEPVNHILHGASVVLGVIDNLALGYITLESINSYISRGDRSEH